MLYNNSLYSKLAMGNPLWKLKNRMLDATTATSTDTGDYYQFVLIGGHDTTIMPMLAAILGEEWDAVWASYASLLTFELYNTTTPDQYLFRMVYNGKALVVPGCSDSLCDLDILMEVLAFAQEYMPCDSSDATATDDPEPVPSPTAAPADDCVMGRVMGMGTDDWVGITVASCAAGVIMGAFLLHFLQRAGLVCASRGAKWSSSDDKAPLRDEVMKNVASDIIVNDTL